MGSCVSVHKDQESAMKLRFSIGSKNEKLLIPSPVKEKPDMVNGGDRTIADVALKRSPPRFRDAGSKDEAFFDSQPWLESDCEDDYFSVNGEFTPSRGSTPVHHSFSSGNQRTNKAPQAEPATNAMAEPSPPDKKKRLSELFKESLRGEPEYVDEETSAVNKTESPAKALSASKSVNGTPYLSGATSANSSERTPNGVLRTEDKSSKSIHCCLPGLLSSHSYNERRKRTSPEGKVG
ncbi:hypothetical protein CDL12_17620 [Handroanthus impetiginosus]|uniref:Uncharacterized protein n=1 Tax=Handroanthus impetiginosus TaxID=429701 RepID=A0A2G9GX18_9LAMI|nr:hypothetical protein CDL12_17620 [Handroanthus impetiginosus]